MLRIRSTTRLRRRGLAPMCLLLAGIVTAATSAVSLSNISVPSYAVPLQGAAAGTVTLDQSSRTTVVVGLSSSNPKVVGVPTSVPIAPNTNSGTFVATGVGPGCAKVTATLGETTRSRYVIVHPASSATTFTMTVPNQFLFLGASTPVSVSNGTGPGLTTVSLSSSNPSIASVPPSVQLTHGSASFSITTRAEGCATITATLGSQTVRRTVQVLYIPG